MYTTKNKLAEQIIRLLDGGDPSDDSKHDKRAIILHIEQAVAFLVKGNFLKTLLVADTGIDSHYISTFRNVEVLRDDELEMSYSEIPHSYIELPKDKGIHLVCAMKAQDVPYVPVRNGSQALYSHSAASNLEGRTGFWPEAKRIYYTKDIFTAGCKKVLMKLIVPSPSNVDDDDSYPISTDMELPVINQVLQLMGVNVPTDDVNDNSSK